MAKPYFKKSFKGYDCEEVDKFIIELSDKYAANEKEYEEKLRAAASELETAREAIKRLESESAEDAKRHSAELEDQKKEYGSLCAQVGENMIVFDRRANEIVASAEREAAEIKAKARAEADADAAEIRRRAEAEAGRMIDDTERRCGELARAAEEFRKRREEMQKSLVETDRLFGDALSKLRDDISGGEETKG